MSRIFSILTVVCLLVVGAGCGGDKAKEKDKAAGGEKTSADGQQTLDLSHLSAEDQELAKQQKTCPVGGGLLGAGGMKVVKIEVEGRQVFLCCEGCETMFRKDPATYFAKLDGSPEPAK